MDNQINDVHVILYESKYQLLADMYKPTLTANPATILCEPFSTSLGISICNAETTNFEGTAVFFFVDSAQPGKLFVHVLFHPDREEKTLYRFHEESGDPKRKVLDMGEAAFKTRCGAIKATIGAKEIIIAQLVRRLEAASNLDEKDAIRERNAASTLMNEVNTAIEVFKKLHADVLKD